MTARTRSRGALTSTNSVNTQLRYNAASVVETKPGQQVGTYETMSDVVTSDFTKLRNQGKIVSNPMLKTRLNQQYLPRTSTWTWIKKPGFTWTTGDGTGFSITDPLFIRRGVCVFPYHEVPPWDETSAGIALAQARSKAASSEAALLVTLGEARETIAMIGRSLDILRGEAIPFFELQRRFHRGELKYADFLREISETWLLYRYGLTPLFYEIGGYVKALVGDSKFKRETTRGKQTSNSGKTWFYTPTSSLVQNIRIDWVAGWTDTYRATCMYEYMDDLQARLGLRLVDVPSAALELTRLSFVADWFVNLSEFLSSLTLAARANVLMQCVVRRIDFDVAVTYSESGSVDQPSMYSSCQQDGSGAKVLFSYTSKERRPYPNSAVGDLSPRVQLNAKRMADAAALLATAFDVKGLRARGVRL